MGDDSVFEVVAPVTMKIALFWDVVRKYEGEYRCPLSTLSLPISPPPTTVSTLGLKMKRT
jgi:hypothetical protein